MKKSIKAKTSLRTVLSNGYFRLGMIALFVKMSAMNVMGQQVDFDDLTDGAEDLKDSAFGILDIVAVIILGIGLAITIGQYMTNGAEQGKKWLIGWLTATAIYVVGSQVLGIG